ncbi:MAG: ornithine carbamoyltransferase [Actinomycetota bacterium]|nr:ornithine carbamoyltransferase [Actinomycetota bacterium]
MAEPEPPRHFLEVDDLDGGELTAVLDAAERTDLARVLDGRGAALLFEKPSNRTRSATEMAVVQLGGHPLSIRGDEVGFDTRETVEDVARTLACYHAVIGARVFAHGTVERLAAVSPVPVVNLLSDHAHPFQALADLLTLRQRWGSLEGKGLAWVGDFNNVARSLCLGAALSGIDVAVAAPEGYGPSQTDLERLATHGCRPAVSTTPDAAVTGAHAVVTDTWASMGQEAEAEVRRKAFAGFTVDAALMARAAEGAVFLHCLPAHRGEEVAPEVIDGPASVVWTEAANRMHVARGLLWWLLDGAGTTVG